jgi:hypothetical protein
LRVLLAWVFLRGLTKAEAKIKERMTWIAVLAPLLVLFTSCEPNSHKIDREVGWRADKIFRR